MILSQNSNELESQNNNLAIEINVDEYILELDLIDE